MSAAGGGRGLAGLLAAIVLALAGCGDGDEGAEPLVPPAVERPNFVIVLTDDQDVASLAVMPQTMRLIGDAGTEFTNSYVTTPECCPSRASLLTGQYAHNHGVLTSSPPEGGYGALDGSETLPVWLRRDGYRTAFLGKYLNGYGSPGQGNDPAEIPPGWDRWAALTDGTEHQMYDYVLNRDGALRSYGAAPRDYLTDVLADRAVADLRRLGRGQKPFLLLAAPNAPHGEGPLEGTGAPRDPRPAPRDLGSFDGRLPVEPAIDEADPSQLPSALRSRARLSARRIGAGELDPIVRGRLESLLAVDRMVRRMVGELERSGQLERTVFVFTSDNGFMLGEHGLLGKETPYEPSAGVPLLVRGPGFGIGATSDALVANIDLAPTIVELAGARAGIEPDGRSIVGAADPARELLIEYLDGPRRYRALRSSDALYARYAEGGELLFDLANDPGERDNLASDPAGEPLRAELEAELERLAECAGPSCR